MAHFVIISGQKYFNARQVAFPPATAWGDLESSIKGDSYEVSMPRILSFWFTILNVLLSQLISPLTPTHLQNTQ